MTACGEGIESGRYDVLLAAWLSPAPGRGGIVGFHLSQARWLHMVSGT
jgi:hypothetical protein